MKTKLKDILGIAAWDWPCWPRPPRLGPAKCITNPVQIGSNQISRYARKYGDRALQCGH